MLFCVSALPTFMLLPGSVSERVFVSLFIGVIIGLMVFPIAEIRRRKENNIDLFATLETNPEKVKARMLMVMQFGHEHGMVGALKEFNDIFRNYPQWELQNWEEFRAWYKYEIDHMLLYPDIYHLTIKGTGKPYNKEADPLYDPDAPDWALYDRDHTHDDEDDEDIFNDDKKDTSRSISESISLGIGIGFGNSIFGGSLFDSGNSENSAG